MAGVNKVILVGNLGADPETRYMPSGGAVSTANIATSRSWRDKATGEMKEHTEWHRTVFFNRLGEIAAEYLKKGSQVYIEGRLQTKKWQTQEGQDRWTTEIIVDQMQMLGARVGGGGGDTSYDRSSGQGERSQQAGPPQSPPQGPPQQSRASAPQSPANAPSQGPPPGNDFDDDIPF